MILKEEGIVAIGSSGGCVGDSNGGAERPKAVLGSVCPPAIYPFLCRLKEILHLGKWLSS